MKKFNEIIEENGVDKEVVGYIKNLYSSKNLSAEVCCLSYQFDGEENEVFVTVKVKCECRVYPFVVEGYLYWDNNAECFIKHSSLRNLATGNTIFNIYDDDALSF